MQNVTIVPSLPQLPPRLAGWDLSALTYRWTYGPLSHQLDGDLLAYLGNRVEGATVADCGCGPGIVAHKLVSHGAAKVFAIDASAQMLRRIPKDPRVEPVQATMESLPLDRLRRERAPSGFDLVLFKRSLYMDRRAAIAVLRNAYGHLRPGGCLAIVHAERALGAYLFGGTARIGRYTPYHLLNRVLSLVSQFFGAHTYALYTRGDLLDLAASVAGMPCVEVIPSGQRALNLVAIRRPQ